MDKNMSKGRIAYIAHKGVLTIVHVSHTDFLYFDGKVHHKLLTEKQAKACCVDFLENRLSELKEEQNEILLKLTHNIYREM